MAPKHATNQADEWGQSEDGVHVDGRQPAEEGCCQHHAFDTDVDHPGAFTENAGERSQRQRGGNRDGGCQHTGDDDQWVDSLRCQS